MVRWEVLTDGDVDLGALGVDGETARESTVQEAREDTAGLADGVTLLDRVAAGDGLAIGAEVLSLRDGELRQDLARDQAGERGDGSHGAGGNSENGEGLHLE